MANDREVIYHFEPGKGWVPRLPPRPGDYIKFALKDSVGTRLLESDWQGWYRARRLYGR